MTNPQNIQQSAIQPAASCKPGSTRYTMPKSELLHSLSSASESAVQTFVKETTRRQSLLNVTQKHREQAELRSKTYMQQMQKDTAVSQFKFQVEEAKDKLKLAGYNLAQIQGAKEFPAKLPAEPNDSPSDLASIVKFDSALKEFSLAEWIQRQDEVQSKSKDVIKQAVEYYDSVRPPGIIPNSEDLLFNRIDFMASDHYMEKQLGLIKDPLILQRRRRKFEKMVRLLTKKAVNEAEIRQPRGNFQFFDPKVSKINQSLQKTIQEVSTETLQTETTTRPQSKLTRNSPPQPKRPATAQTMRTLTIPNAEETQSWSTRIYPVFTGGSGERFYEIIQRSIFRNSKRSKSKEDSTDSRTARDVGVARYYQEESISVESPEVVVGPLKIPENLQQYSKSVSSSQKHPLWNTGNEKSDDTISHAANTTRTARRFSQNQTKPQLLLKKQSRFKVLLNPGEVGTQEQLKASSRAQTERQLHPHQLSLVVNSARSYRPESRDRETQAPKTARPSQVTGNADYSLRRRGTSQHTSSNHRDSLLLTGSLDRNLKANLNRSVVRKDKVPGVVATQSQSSGILIGGVDEELTAGSRNFQLRVQSSKHPVVRNNTKTRLMLRPSTAVVQPIGRT